MAATVGVVMMAAELNEGANEICPALCAFAFLLSYIGSERKTS